jgi:rRNA processing protein Krr1/Pno1
MRKIFLSKVLRILKSKKILEEELKVKIEIKGREAEISGTPEQEYLAEQVILAVDFGFEISVALMIKQEDLLFEY